MKSLALLGAMSLLITTGFTGFTTSYSLVMMNIDSDVYICSGPYSKKYHYANGCRGMSNCSTGITKIKKSKAQEMGRTACGIEN